MIRIANPIPATQMIKPPPFPFRRVLSLSPLIDAWRDRATRTPGLDADLAARVLAEIDATPLDGPLDDPSMIDSHHALVAALMTAIFPPAREHDVYGAALTPFDLEPVFTTPGFQRLGLARRLREQLDDERHARNRAVIAYRYVLRDVYGVESDFALPLVLTVPDPETGLERHFRLEVDPRFCRAVPVRDAPELTPAQLERLLAEPTNLELWMERLPPAAFELHGLSVLIAADVTEQQVLAALTSDLLAPDAMASGDRVDALQARLRALLRQPDVDLGLICLRRDDEDMITGALPVGRSLLLSEGGVPHCPNRANSVYQQVIDERRAALVHDLADCDFRTGYEAHVLGQGKPNLLVVPLQVGDRLVGLIELGSARTGTLDVLDIRRLEEVAGLFATAMKRMLDDGETLVQAVIKQQYTAIHPAVEWRFREAAQHWLASTGRGERAEPEPIVFPDVYPLYGLSDVRGSSNHRAASVQADLLEQLGLARAAITEANRARPLPVLAELDHRIAASTDAVAGGLRAGDELRVLDFLHGEIEPVFEAIRDFGGSTAARIRDYRNALDPEVGFLYRRRRDFEKAITLINDTVSSFVEREQERAQAMFPHYFEKYVTDGVDYSIYVGASLTKDGGFDPIYLRNLRLWQLMLMSGIVWELRRIEDRLPLPLEVAHLVLVQTSPLAIRFRPDEKQFDVDGAYNIRYQIVKKRIDKARVRGTREPLTQPGRIAIVYSREQEAAEYAGHIDFLRSAGYFAGDVEDLELDDLQGASGLRALRVTVAAEPVPARERPAIEHADVRPATVARAVTPA